MSLKIIGKIEISDIVDEPAFQGDQHQQKDGNIHLFLLKQIFNELKAIKTELQNQAEQILIIKQQNHSIMQTLDDLKAAVEAENTVIDSAVTLLQGLSAQIAALKPDQAAIDALATEVKAKSDALAAAVTANTPAQ